MTASFGRQLRQWTTRADIHVEDVTGAYAVERFLAGEDVLYPIEAGEVGDVSGLKLLHLQCHIGLDTLSLARRGADATGIDFSPNALRHAREFAAKAGLAARFVEGDVYRAPEIAGTGYDVPTPGDDLAPGHPRLGQGRRGGSAARRAALLRRHAPVARSRE